MVRFFLSLFAWLPTELLLICSGVVVIFFLVFVLRFIRFVVDLIPFL